MQTDAEIRANTPVKIFKLNGAWTTVKILSINKADDWFKLIVAADAAEVTLTSAVASGNHGRMLEARKAFSAAIYDCVFGYSEELSREKLGDQVSPAQMTMAYETLRTLTDPFELIQTRLTKDLGAPLAELMTKAQEMAQISQTPDTPDPPA